MFCIKFPKKQNDRWVAQAHLTEPLVFFELIGSIAFSVSSISQRWPKGDGKSRIPNFELSYFTSKFNAVFCI